MMNQPYNMGGAATGLYGPSGIMSPTGQLNESPYGNG